MSKMPSIGVVIPAFGHPRLLAEAISSACAQDIDASLTVVVVDDGCLQLETRDVIQSLLARFQGRLFSVRQSNTRLPGARNKGIDFLLKLRPDLDAAYLLDADNRLPAHALRRFYDCLKADPKAGWAYPDIGFFGFLPHADGLDVRETAPNYSKLKHLVANVSEAGSMVRGDLLRAGLRFDETLTVGFEDWDFWLSALDRGYHGVRAEGTGFAYRKRPESMLAEASRQHEAVQGHVIGNHPNLFCREFIDQTRQTEAPSFAVLCVPKGDNAGGVSCFFDPCEPGLELSFDTFADWVVRRIRNSREHFFPTRIVTVDEAAWQAIQGSPKGLTALFAQVISTPDRACLKILDPTGQHVSLYVQAGIPFLERAASKTVSPFDGFSDAVHYWRTDLNTNDRDKTALQQDYEHLLEPCLSALPVSRSKAKRYAGPDADTVIAQLSKTYCATSLLAPVFPKIRSSRDILMAVPSTYLSNSDALAELELACDAADKDGKRVFLCVELASGQSVPEISQALFDKLAAVLPFNMDQSRADGMLYQGRDLKLRLSDATYERACALANAFSNIWGTADCAMLEVFGIAREDGAQTKILAHSSLISDVDLAFSRIMAYEHAILDIAGATGALSDRLRAAGLPAIKVSSEQRKYRLRERLPKPIDRPMGWRPEKGFVFVVTHGRSGSTALMQVLNSFEGYEIRGENNQLLPPLLEFLQRVDDLGAKADVYRSNRVPSPWQGIASIKPDSVTDKMIQMLIKDIWNASESAVRLGFKEIRYMDMTEGELFKTLDQMRHFLSPAKLVFNIRPAEETAQSGWFANWEPEDAIAALEGVQDRFQRYAQKHPEDCILMNHADYRGNPDAFQPLCEFLGERYEHDSIAGILNKRLKH